MTDLRQAAQMALDAWDDPAGMKDLCVAMDALRTALEQQAEPVAVYGYCPDCGAKGVTRERRPNGDDKCTNGHTYPSSTATPVQPLLMNHNGAVRKVHGYPPAPPQQQAEPVATVQCVNGITIGYIEVMQPVGTKLYTTPPQQKAEPVAVVDEAIHAAWSAGFVEGEKAALEQQAEPVAWMRLSKDGYDSAFRDHSTVVRCTGNPWTGWVPLYSTPLQRQWVGLTHAQTKECLQAWDENDAYALCRAIEAKLKEKNDR